MADPPRTIQGWRKLTEEQLIQEAQDGLRGQGASIEMLRRIAHVASQNTTRRLTWVIGVCTVLLLIGQGVQIYLQYYPGPIGVYITAPPAPKGRPTE